MGNLKPEGRFYMKVAVEKIVHGGYGLARLDGQVCLVPYSVPGDVLDIDCERREGMLFGRIARIERPSSFRKTARCSAFGLCGGCDFDNMAYEFELEVKRDILLEDLSRIAGIEDLQSVHVVFAEKYFYRNHAQFKVDEEGRVGFFKQKSREVVELPSSGCLLLQHSITDYARNLIGETRFFRGGFRVRSNARKEIFKKGIPGVDDDRYVFQYIGGAVYRLGIDDFFQVNGAIVEKWLSTIESYLEPHKEDTVFDIFCGSGLISIYIARKVRTVVGVEINRCAVENARYNAEYNMITNAAFIRRNAMKGFDSDESDCKVIVDPPRAGLSPRLIQSIARMHPSRIVYVSCDTATFSRDIYLFAEEGYSLQKVSIVDMFPRTAHMEVVAGLEPST